VEAPRRNGRGYRFCHHRRMVSLLRNVMLDKSRFMAALIVLLARLAAAAAGRTKAASTKPT